MTPAILIIFLPFMVLSCPLSDNICRYGTASNRNSTRLLAAQYKLLVSPTYSSLVSPVHPVSPVHSQPDTVSAQVHSQRLHAAFSCLTKYSVHYSIHSDLHPDNILYLQSIENFLLHRTFHIFIFVFNIIFLYIYHNADLLVYSLSKLQLKAYLLIFLK